jgi:urea transport system ATP-binding protein
MPDNIGTATLIAMPSAFLVFALVGIAIERGVIRFLYGRVLVIDPKLLILDKPTEGIQPNIVQEIGDIITRLNREIGLTVLLVEQKLPFARKVADRFCILDRGHHVAAGEMDQLNDDLIRQYLTV